MVFVFCSIMFVTFSVNVWVSSAAKNHSFCESLKPNNVLQRPEVWMKTKNSIPQRKSGVMTMHPVFSLTENAYQR